MQCSSAMRRDVALVTQTFRGLLKPNKDDVECMTLLGGHLFTGDYGGRVKVGSIWYVQL